MAKPTENFSIEPTGVNMYNISIIVRLGGSLKRSLGMVASILLPYHAQLRQAQTLITGADVNKFQNILPPGQLEYG